MEPEKELWIRHFSVSVQDSTQAVFNPCAFLISLISRIHETHLVTDAITCLEAMLKHKNDELRSSFLQAFLQGPTEEFNEFVKTVFLEKADLESAGPKTLNKLIRQLQKASGLQHSSTISTQMSKDSHDTDIEKSLALALEISALDVEATLRDNLLGLEEDSKEGPKQTPEKQPAGATVSTAAQRAKEGYLRLLKALLGAFPAAFAKGAESLKVQKPCYAISCFDMLTVLPPLRL